jgi:hypothetical protein
LLPFYSFLPHDKSSSLLQLYYQTSEACLIVSATKALATFLPIVGSVREGSRDKIDCKKQKFPQRKKWKKKLKRLVDKRHVIRAILIELIASVSSACGGEVIGHLTISYR